MYNGNITLNIKYRVMVRSIKLYSSPHIHTWENLWFVCYQTCFNALLVLILELYMQPGTYCNSFHLCYLCNHWIHHTDSYSPHIGHLCIGYLDKGNLKSKIATLVSCHMYYHIQLPPPPPPPAQNKEIIIIIIIITLFLCPKRRSLVVLQLGWPRCANTSPTTPSAWPWGVFAFH